MGAEGCGREKAKREGLATGRKEKWGSDVQASAKLLPTAERAVLWLPDLLGITRRCRVIRASSSRSLKRSRSSWPLKRQYR